MSISIIKILLFSSLLGIGGSALAQSQLLPCPESGYRDNCWAAVDLLGNKYEGEFWADKPDGRGIFTDASGNKFVGEFKAGKRDGRGIEYLPNGSLSRVGIWSDDKFVMADSVVPSSAAPDQFALIPIPSAPNTPLPASQPANSVPSCPIQVQPVMPYEAVRDGVGGQVKAQARIKDGVVTEVTIISGPSVFHEAVRDAMKKYKCTNGATAFTSSQEFNFRVEGTDNKLPRTEREYVKQVESLTGVAAQPATDPSLIRMGVVCPTQVPPEMPSQATHDGTEGVVKAQIHIGKGGVIKDVTIISGPPVFRDAVRAAMVQYKCVNDGSEIIATQVFNFKLDKAPSIIDALIRIFK